jgi:hypothetical protein
MTHRDFRLSLVKKLIERVESTSPTSSPGWAMCFTETRFEVKFSSHCTYPSPDCTAELVLHEELKEKRSQVTCKK